MDVLHVVTYLPTYLPSLLDCGIAGRFILSHLGREDCFPFFVSAEKKKAISGFIPLLRSGVDWPSEQRQPRDLSSSLIPTYLNDVLGSSLVREAGGGGLREPALMDELDVDFLDGLAVFEFSSSLLRHSFHHPMSSSSPPSPTFKRNELCKPDTRKTDLECQGLPRFKEALPRILPLRWETAALFPTPSRIQGNNFGVGAA